MVGGFCRGERKWVADWNEELDLKTLVDGWYANDLCILTSGFEEVLRWILDDVSLGVARVKT
jgi:hypothetical protein